VKPNLLLLLLQKFNEEQVVLFDPDILLLRPLDELRSLLAAARIVLTPNLTRPNPADDLKPADQDFLIAGAYSSGFLALSNSEQALECLRWWEERLRDGEGVIEGEGVLHVPKGLLTDQKWIDLVPTLFSATAILREETYNVGAWNLHDRLLSRQGHQFLVNG